MTTQTPEQQRDALLLRLLKTPPQPRPKRERGDETQVGNAAGSGSTGAHKRKPKAK